MNHSLNPLGVLGDEKSLYFHEIHQIQKTRLSSYDYDHETEEEDCETDESKQIQGIS